MKSTLAFIITMILCGSLSAHALRIETKPSGQVNQKHEIKVYYSEYALNQDEDFKDWYSDVAEFKLFLLSPSGKKAELNTTAENNYRKAAFTPSENGTYTMFIGHSSKDLDGTWMYQFNASATVVVGDGQPELVKEGNDLQVVLDVNKGQKISGTVYYRGVPLENANVSVVSPSFWSKSLTTNDSGKFEVTSQGKGRYFIETTHVEDVKGEHFDQTYEHIWRCATLHTNI